MLLILQTGGSSAQLMMYVTKHVLPALNSIDGDGERLSILKYYAEMSNGCHDTTVAEACAPILYPILTVSCTYNENFYRNMQSLAFLTTHIFINVSF